MLLDRAQEVVRSIGAKQFLGTFDLFVEVPDRLHQQFGASVRGLGV
jgi:hypothetical protein